MTCARYENDLALHVERDLPPADVPAVEAHLRECAECRRFLEELRASQSLVHGLAVEEIERDGLAELRERVVAAAMSPAATRVQWVSPAVWAAAAIVVIGVGWMTRGGEELRRPGVVQEAIATTESSRPQRPTRHESTDAAMAGVSHDMDRARHARRARVPVLSREDADQLARAVVAVAEIRSAHDRPAEPDPSPDSAPLMRVASTDPNVVIYWQLDPNGGE